MCFSAKPTKINLLLSHLAVDTKTYFINVLMIGFLLLMMVLVSPTLLILWMTIDQIGLTWSLLLIPTGAMIGAVVMAIIGACLSAYNFWLDDRQTGLPPSGSFAGLGRGIVTLVLMVLLGWIGSGIGACGASHWIRHL